MFCPMSCKPEPLTQLTHSIASLTKHYGEIGCCALYTSLSRYAPRFTATKTRQEKKISRIQTYMSAQGFGYSLPQP